MRHLRRLVPALLAGMLGAAVLASSASAAKPTIERIDVEFTAPDIFLSEECGVDVTTHVEGHVIVRTFPDRDKGTVELTTLNLVLTATAGENSYRFRDVGADHVQVKRDGSAIVLIVGQVPFGFTGVLKIDAATGEVIHEPSHSLEGRLEDACEALTA